MGEIPVFRWITTALRSLSPWEVCVYLGTEGTLRLYVIGVLGILEDVKAESPAQANDVSKGLGTWGPRTVPRNSSLVLSHKGLPSFPMLMSRSCVELWTERAAGPAPAALLWMLSRQHGGDEAVPSAAALGSDLYLADGVS